MTLNNKSILEAFNYSGHLSLKSSGSFHVILKPPIVDIFPRPTPM